MARSRRTAELINLDEVISSLSSPPPFDATHDLRIVEPSDAVTPAAPAAKSRSPKAPSTQAPSPPLSTPVSSSINGITAFSANNNNNNNNTTMSTTPTPTPDTASTTPARQGLVPETMRSGGVIPTTTDLSAAAAAAGTMFPRRHCNPRRLRHELENPPKTGVHGTPATSDAAAVKTDSSAPANSPTYPTRAPVHAPNATMAKNDPTQVTSKSDPGPGPPALTRTPAVETTMTTTRKPSNDRTADLERRLKEKDAQINHLIDKLDSRVSYCCLQNYCSHNLNTLHKNCSNSTKTLFALFFRNKTKQMLIE